MKLHKLSELYVFITCIPPFLLVFKILQSYSFDDDDANYLLTIMYSKGLFRIYSLLDIKVEE